MFLK
jgi:hypothetical protein